MGSDHGCVSQLPLSLRNKFPCVLSHRSGLDLQLHRLLRPLIDNGIPFEAIASTLEEVHSLTYYDDLMAQQSLLLELEHKLPPIPDAASVPKGAKFGDHLNNPLYRKDTDKVLSSFDDKDKYGGCIPSAGYLRVRATSATTTASDFILTSL